MKKSLKIKPLLLKWFVSIALLLPLSHIGDLRAQVSFPFTFPNSSNDYLGWGASVTDNLEITHNTIGESIVFSTANIERMRIDQNGRTTMGIPGVPSSNLTQLSIYPNIDLPEGLSCTIDNQSSVPFSKGLSVILSGAQLVQIGIDVLSVSDIENNFNYASQGYAYGGVSNYAVFASVGSSFAGDYAGDFDGPVRYTNSFTPSDENLKLDVNPLSDADAILSALHPVKFQYIEHPDLVLPIGNQFGFIAQEVAEVLPNLVQEKHIIPHDLSESSEMDETFLTLSKTEIIPVLIKGSASIYSEIIGNQSAISDLQNRIEEVENSIISLQN